ncbi:MAG: chalcone isomerase family protein [Rickettsiales bacterium]|jgi:hypothetical protein|nr:chalcone isomerase family protein [Rickettsiales bacterium]
MRNLLLSFAALSLAPLAALAKPAEIEKTISAESPYGKAALTRLIFHAYDAELWTDTRPWSYDAPFALSLTYRMDFTSEELVDKTLEELMRIHGDRSSFKADLTSAFPAVKDGERITAVFLPKQGVRFYYNGSKTAVINSASFAREFFDIWLSEKTSEPRLRRKLLGLNS